MTSKTHSREQLAEKISRRLGRLLTYVGLLIVALVMAWLAVKAYRIYSIYQAMSSHLDSLQTLVSAGEANLTGLDLARLEHDLRGAATGMEKLYGESKPFLPLARHLGWVPRYGGDIQAVPYVLAAGREVSRAGLILLEEFRPLLEPGASAAQASQPSRAIAAFDRGRPTLERAERLLVQAGASLQQVDNARLSPGIASRLAPLREYLPLATSGLQIAQRLPGLLGAGSPQVYLVLTQNSDELRPTGGYINAAGHVILDQGRIVEFIMQDSYAVDKLSQAYPYPPDPIREYMAADYWVLRDANWSPDFPTSARTAIELYELGQGISADGVVALDQQALAYLIRAFEPIDVAGEQVTGENVIELMRQHWAPDQDQAMNEWWRGRKSFMLEVAQAVRQKAEGDLGAIKFSVLLEALGQALAEKHILLYMSDPAMARFLEERNWAGALAPVEGDYLLAVDANLGFNKASALVERRLTYQVRLAEEGGAQAHATLLYQHRGRKQGTACRHEPRYDPVYVQNMERCYWDYLRLVVPGDAQLVSGPEIVVDGRYLQGGRSTTGEIDIASPDADKVSWGQLSLLPAGESLVLDYVYTLPPGTARRLDDGWVYNLFLQKQPGTPGQVTEVVVTLPHGAQLLSSSPDPHSHQGGVVTYVLSTATDRRIQIVYR
jgi:hypothetical protein